METMTQATFRKVISEMKETGTLVDKQKDVGSPEVVSISKRDKLLDFEV